MKINWGTGIVIAFVCFIAFIMYFVVNMTVGKQYQHDLVIEDYYKQELTFQNDINKEQNAQKLPHNLYWKRTEHGLKIVFPEDFNDEEISGTILLYRPSNKSLDLRLPLKVNSHTFIIPKENLVDGRWNLTVDWQRNDTKYLFKESIVY